VELQWIEPTCPACGKKFAEPAYLAGQTFECPGCHGPVRTIKVTGRTDFENAVFTSPEARARSERALAAGQSTGFRQFRAPADEGPQS
jgi:hypothetical protein